MRARLFRHELNLPVSLFQMAFQVKFLASRGENSTEQFMQDSSTLFSYEPVHVYGDVAELTMARYEVGIIDDKLSEIFTDACLNKRPLKMEKTADGGAKITVLQSNELIIKDVNKECYDPQRDADAKYYFSDDPCLTRRIYELLQKEYDSKFPENFPKLDLSVNNKQWKLRVTGTKEQIIAFTDALIAIANRQSLEPVVDAENKSGYGL